MNPNAGEPVNPGGVAPVEPASLPVNPLSDLENVVAAAQQAAETAPPSAGIRAETPRRQFEDQFGPGPDTSPVAEVPVAPLDPSIKIVDDLLAKGPQVIENPNPTVEAVAPAEQTPAEKLRKEIAASVDRFLEEVTKEKAAV